LPAGSTGEEHALRAVYLTGDRVYIRALLLGDKEHATAWFDSPFPINATRAEEYLRETHKGQLSRRLPLVIARRDTDEVIGGVLVRSNDRHADIRTRMAPWLADGDDLRAAALRLLVPWLRDEAQHMTVTVEIAADQARTIATAEQLGMQQTARFREYVARPGGRVDLLILQALNPFWERAAEGDARA
jgi:RimJ/RimL family protein N-acetyltransferase